MQEQVVVKQLTPGVWVIQLRSSVGVSVGRTSYPTKDEAIATAEQRYPGAEITIEE